MKRTRYPKRGSMVADYKYSGPISFDPKYGWLASGQFPAECIAECSAGGQVDSAVEDWVSRLKLTEALEPVRALAVRYLKEFGAWDDLGSAPIETLANRVLWVACCDIAEQGEWAGLVH